MKLRMLYFALGLAFALPLAAALFLWDAHRDFSLKQRAESLFALAHKPKPPPGVSDLVGTWHGETSWGMAYTITRRSDGSFTEVLDSHQADVIWHPPVVQSSGRWSLQGTCYAYYYTKSTNPDFTNYGIEMHDIDMQTPRSLNYAICEGNAAWEEKR